MITKYPQSDTYATYAPNSQMAWERQQMSPRARGPCALAGDLGEATDCGTTQAWLVRISGESISTWMISLCNCFKQVNK